MKSQIREAYLAHFGIDTAPRRTGLKADLESRAPNPEYRVRKLVIEDLRLNVSRYPGEINTTGHAIVEDVMRPNKFYVLGESRMSSEGGFTEAECAFLSACHFTLHELAENFAKDNGLKAFDPHKDMYSITRPYLNELLRKAITNRSMF